jgi:hypothetical protein
MGKQMTGKGHSPVTSSRDSTSLLSVSVFHSKVVVEYVNGSDYQGTRYYISVPPIEVIKTEEERQQ